MFQMKHLNFEETYCGLNIAKLSAGISSEIRVISNFGFPITDDIFLIILFVVIESSLFQVLTVLKNVNWRGKFENKIQTLSLSLESLE